MNTDSAHQPVALRPLSSAEEIQRILAYTFANRRMHILVAAAVAVAVIGIVLVFWHQPRGGVGMSLWDSLQVVLGAATLVVAVCVWFGEASQDWRNEQPRLLSVFCFYEGRPVLVCYHAYLAAEGDIRAWSQQVCGRQMGGGDLAFVPVVDVRRPQLITDGRTAYVHHQVRFTLTEVPTVFGSVPAGQPLPCLVWRPRERLAKPELDDAVPAEAAGALEGVSGWTA